MNTWTTFLDVSTWNPFGSFLKFPLTNFVIQKVPCGDVLKLRDLVCPILRDPSLEFTSNNGLKSANFCWWLRFNGYVQICYLGGGFKYFSCSFLLGEDFQFDEYFSDGLKPPTRLFLVPKKHPQVMKRKGLGVSHWPESSKYIVRNLWSFPTSQPTKKQVAWGTWTIYDALNGTSEMFDKTIHKPSQPATLIAKPVRFAIPGAADCGREPTQGLCRYCCLGKFLFHVRKGWGDKLEGNTRENAGRWLGFVDYVAMDW